MIAKLMRMADVDECTSAGGLGSRACCCGLFGGVVQGPTEGLLEVGSPKVHCSALNNPSAEEKYRINTSIYTLMLSLFTKGNL